MIMPDWRKLWILCLVLAGLFRFGYGWKHARDNPMMGTTKIIEPPEVKLLKKGRYDEAAKAILDSIKDERRILGDIRAWPLSTMRVPKMNRQTVKNGLRKPIVTLEKA